MEYSVENMYTPDYTLSTTTTAALGVGLGFHTLSLIAFMYLSRKATAETLIYYRVNTITYAIATTCYTLMIVGESNYITADGRLVLWARYLEFILGTPLLIIDLCLVAGSTFADIFYLVSCDMLMIACGWFASIAPTAKGKWTMYVLGCLAFAPIVITILTTMRESAKLLGKRIEKIYNMLSVYMLIVWFAYPIVWILHDGTHAISIDTESILHTIIDVLAKDVFGFVLVYSHSVLHHVLSEATIQHKASSSSLFESHKNSFVKQLSIKDRNESVHTFRDDDLELARLSKDKDARDKSQSVSRSRSPASVPGRLDVVHEIVKQSSREIKTTITNNHVFVSVPQNSSNPYLLEIDLPVICGASKDSRGSLPIKRDVSRIISFGRKAPTQAEAVVYSSDEEMPVADKDIDLNVPSTPTRG